MEPNYSGWATKANLKCTDGRTIAPGAFKHQDGAKVPLLYQHNHTDIEQVLGYAVLSHKDEGTWADLFFNSNKKSLEALQAIEHGDLDKLSIWAKDLDERIANREAVVHDGVIQEVSLVLAGANPGASLVNVLAHSAIDTEDEMIIVGFELMHADTKQDEQPAPPVESDPPPDSPEDAPPAAGDKTVADVLATLDDEQTLAVNSFIDDVVTEALTKALAEEPTMQHDNLDSSEKGNHMNVFDRTKKDAPALPQLKHDDVAAILDLAKGPEKSGGTNATTSLRELVRSTAGKELMHADEYGIQNLEILFPDAQSVMARPSWIDRRQEWVKVFLDGTSHTPFSRIKTMYADITADEARARGYIKGNQKVEEVFPVFKRTTGPAWIYKKQKLDRQDIIDIVDFDVVAWMKAEMRGKLDEEIARAGLFGDGRPVMVGGEMNPDKILEPTGNSGEGIRSVINDDDLYSTSYYVPLAPDATGSDWNVLLDAFVDAGEFYLGSGNKTAFMPYRTATRLLTIRDEFGHRMYRNLAEVAGDMDVSRIVRVPTELFPEDVLAISLDLSDYNFGTNRGGEVTLFDDFDIDFNQYKYLIETYLSGALVLPYSAQVFRRVDPGTTTLAEPVRPTIASNVITVPTVTGVVYKRTDTGATVTGGSTITLDADTTKQVTLEAEPASGYYFETDADRSDNYTFRYKA